MLKMAKLEQQLTKDKIHTTMMRAIPLAFIDQCLLNGKDIATYGALRREMELWHARGDQVQE